MQINPLLILFSFFYFSDKRSFKFWYRSYIETKTYNTNESVTTENALKYLHHSLPTKTHKPNSRVPIKTHKILIQTKIVQSEFYNKK